MDNQTMNGGKAKKRVALSSVLAALLLTGMKLLVGIITGSLGILSEAAHSALDLGAAVMTYVAVRISDKPPDESHHYGHGKIEGLSAFIEVLLLLVTCGYIIYEAISRIISREMHVDVTWYAFAVMGVSMVVDISRSTALYRAARKYQSQALEADALHFSSDIFSSLVVIIGLAGYKYLNLPMADSIAALAVAILVIVVSIRLAIRTVHVLLDRAPVGISNELSEAVLHTDGVQSIDAMRIRTSGSQTFVDMRVNLCADLSFVKAHDIADLVEKKITEIIPNADVMVHTNPGETSSSPDSAKIKVAALLKDHKDIIQGHHYVKIVEHNGRYVISFHIEMIGEKTLDEVHNVCDHLERDIKRAVPGSHVTIHVEPKRTDRDDKKKK